MLGREPRAGTYGTFPKSGVPFWGPSSTDYRIWGLDEGAPISGNYHTAVSLSVGAVDEDDTPGQLLVVDNVLSSVLECSMAKYPKLSNNPKPLNSGPLNPKFSMQVL